ncbi:MAG: tyrosine-type recombinase/integrase [Desulfoprunum sp.]
MTQEKVNFTKAAIERMVSPESGRLYVYDEKESGLLLQITPNGRRTFQLYRKFQGRPVRVTIGTYPEYTVEQARKKAREIKTDMGAGKNPNDTLRSQREEMTFGGLFEQYMTRHAKVNKRSWREDQRQYDQYLGKFANKRLSDITKKDIAALHSKVGKEAKTAANRLLSLLSSVFGRGIEFGLWEGTNPCIGIRRFTEQSRDRFLSGDELRRFFEALAQEPSGTARDFFLVSLFTGARRANVLSMQWSDIDLDAASWRIGRTKNGTPQTVALVEPVMEILQDRRKRISSLFVFPGRAREGETLKSGHFVEPRKAWVRICKAAGIEGARIHDLRRTMGSWQAMTGASLPVIGKSLNHKSASTTQIYARLDLDPVRSSMEKAASAMMSAATAPAKVVKLRRAASGKE